MLEVTLRFVEQRLDMVVVQRVHRVAATTDEPGVDQASQLLRQLGFRRSMSFNRIGRGRVRPLPVGYADIDRKATPACSG